MNVFPNPMRRHLGLATALILSFVPIGACHGAGVLPAAVLSRDGNDLVVTLSNPVIFTVTSIISGSSFGFRMPEAINISGTGGFPLSLESGAVLNGRLPGTALIRGGSTLEILYFGSISVAPGGIVPLSPGVIRLPGFFNYSVIQGIRNFEIPLLVLSNSSGQARSAPTAAIPEPSAALYLLGAGILTFARRRRRMP